MVNGWQRAAAAIAALCGLALLVGTGAYLTARDDPPPPTTTTTTTSTTVPVARVAEALAAGLQTDLDVVLTAAEAHCVADGVVAVIPPDELEALAEAAHPAPLAALDEPTRAALLRAVVPCLPPEAAAALLGGVTTTTAVLSLPDEG